MRQNRELLEQRMIDAIRSTRGARIQMEGAVSEGSVEGATLVALARIADAEAALKAAWSEFVPEKQ